MTYNMSKCYALVNFIDRCTHLHHHIHQFAVTVKFHRNTVNPPLSEVTRGQNYSDNGTITYV
jgi:hypothetical protein